MERNDLEKRIRKIAKVKGLAVRWSEGSRHSRVQVGGVVQYVPRHGEINELTARSIIRDIEENA